MPAFDSSGVSINYIDEGSGPAIVLVHGFAASIKTNCRGPGIIDALTGAGRRVVALDCRGHGESGKPHDPEAYAGTRMSDDVIASMDHLKIDVADPMGYSMGGWLSAMLLVRHPKRFRSMIISGMGDAIVTGEPDRRRRKGWRDVARDRAWIPSIRRASRHDPLALAAMQRAKRGGFDPKELAAVTLPVMVLVGGVTRSSVRRTSWRRRSRAPSR